MGLAADDPIPEAPLTSLVCPSPVPKGAFEVAITFRNQALTELKPVTGFEAQDIEVVSGSVSSFSGSGANYKAWITPAVSGTTTVKVPGGVANDSDGTANGPSKTCTLTVQTAGVTIADAWASEGDAISFTATLDGAVVGGLKVTPSFTGGTATKGVDYTENTAALTFTGTKDETQTFTVATIEDTDEEGNEAFFVGMTVSGTSATVEAGPTAKGTILDDDDTPTLTLADASASEGDSLTFTVTLDMAVPGGLTVTPSFTDVTATEGTDYTANTTALTFAGTAGETQTFTVATTEDADVEADETFTVGLAVSETSEAVDTSTATGTILDDDRLPAVTIDDANGSEGGAMTFSVTLDQAVPGGLEVTPGFTDVTATEGTDYTANTTALNFAGTRGEQQTLRVLIPDDSDSEEDETFTVGLTVSGTTATVTATDTGTGTIFDDDAPDPLMPVVTIADSSAAEGEALTFTVTLGYPDVPDGTNVVPGGLAVTPSFTDGTATKGTDYTENTTALSFAGTAGETQTFTVATTEDTDVEGDETFTVGLAVSGTLRNVKATDTATGTITNDDSAPAVTIADAWAAEGDSLTFTVTLDRAVSGGLTVTPSFTDGTATKGTDYTENTTALSFAGTAGETQTFTVATTEDSGAEADETFTVGLAVTGTSETVTATDTATGTIRNDDQPALTIADASASEGDSLTFTVTLDAAVSGQFYVELSFTDGTATEGTDYAAYEEDLVFAGTAGETQSFTVSTTEDADGEADETFTVSLAVTGASTTVNENDTATGTILDDDGALAAVTIADASASEGDDITFTVTLDEAVSGGLTVTPGFTDVTATKGTDYTENTAALTFAGTAGETKHFTVSTTKDTEEEGAETFAVSLSVSGTSATVTATDTASGTITDDEDTAPGGATPTLRIDDASAAEGDSITFTVTLDNAVDGGLTVTPSFTDGTATKGTDYTENTAALSFTGTAGETQSFTVTTTEDTEEEDAETFTVSLSVSGTSATVTATDTATGTIHSALLKSPSDDAAVTVADASASEGDDITFTVTLDKAVSGGLTVTPSFTDVTATEGTDYTENTSALTLAGTAGETQTFTVSTTEDTAVEANETFTVSLAVSGTSATVTATDTATGTITNDDGALAAVTVADASAAEGDSITFTVTLDNAVSGGLTVTPSFTDVTATEGTDYTENTTALTFTGTAGETQSFTVATSEDTDVEADETFTVSLAVSGTSATITATDTATGTVTNDDGGAAVTIEDVSASEGDSITFTVTLDKAVSGGLTVTPSFTDGTATSGTDYTENTAALTFAGTAGETQSFTVATTEDTTVEANETFTVSLAVSGTSATVTATDTATGTITNDDGAVAAVTIADAAASEGDDITFTVTLDKAVSGGLTVTPDFTDGTAAKGTDYTENTAALTFAGTAGETQSFTVATTEDTTVEASETFSVGLTVSGTSATVTATDTATGTITNDDGSAAVTIADAAASEGDDITFTVTLDKAVSGGLTVTPAFTDGTAAKGTDYTENTAALTFAGTAGETKTFTVATTEDSVVETDETFTVGLAVSGTSLAATVTATDTATGTITNDDGSAAVTVADVSASEGETLTFTVTLDKAVSGGLTVTPSFTDGTAAKGTDYTENTTALTFTGTAGETQSFTVATTEDTTVEANETFTVGLAVSGTTATVTATDTATGTITNDDGSAAVTIEDVAASEGDSITFTVTLSKTVSGGLTVTPSFADGTAAKGTDYTENTAGLTFAGTAGETQTFTVATSEDAVVEPDEMFTVSLAVSATSAPVTATDTATGTITDDDGSAAVTVADVSASEGETLTFTVTLDKAVSGGLTVTPGFTDGTATEGADYTENTAGLTFAGTAGETQTFTVATSEDAVVEPDETFTVSLAVSATSAPVTATDTATGTITDDDGSATVTVADASASEGDAITFTVTLSKAVSGGLTVTPGFTDGTATEGSDYTENTTAHTFTGTANETRTFTISTTEDTAVEANETFTVSLAVSGTSASVTATDTATGTITNDDGSAAVTVADASTGEGETLTFTVTLNKAVSGGLTVTPSFTDVTATEGADYTENTAGIAFTGTADETKTFTVRTTEDSAVEPDETFTVSLAVSGTSAPVTATDTATGTITDDDGSAAVTVADASSGEGETLSFTVTLDKAVPGGLTVTPSFTDVTATEGADYTENPAGIAFRGTADETKTFTVRTTEDSAVEPDETFTVNLAVSGTSAPVTATDTATGTITDDDGSAAVTVADASASEGETLTFTVTLDKAVPGGLTVTPGFTDGTATAGTDYTENTSALTFTGTAGETRSFTVTTNEDADDEPDETFTVNLTVSGTQATVTATDTATGTILEIEDAAAARLVVRMEPDVIPENAGPTLVTVIAEIVGPTPTTALPVTMTVGDNADTAESAIDYEMVDAFTVTIPAGASQESATFLLAPIEDNLIEGHETLTVTGEASRLGEASDQGTIRDEDLEDVRSEGTGRTLFLLARAIGSESLAAIEERFASAGLGRRARLGRLPTLAPGAAIGSTGLFAAPGVSGTGLGLPAVAGQVGQFGSHPGSFAGFRGHGLGSRGMGPSMPVQDQPFDKLAWLDGANFAAPLGRAPGTAENQAGPGSDDDAAWMIWGRAATTRTAVQAMPGAQARGDLFTMHAGVDTRVGSRVLLGVAVSHSQGKLGYTLGSRSDAAPAAVEGGLTSVQPYVQWTPRAGLELWGLGGSGRGSLKVSDTFGTVDTGVGMRLAAGGVRQQVSAAVGLAVKADVFHVGLASDAHSELPEARATATRARTLIEWQSEWTPSKSTRIRPRVETGGRWDGGSDVGGFGAEVGGGVALVHVGLNLEVAGAARYLLAHQADGFEEWGASVALRAGPGVTGSGPWVSLEPEWGAAASRMQALSGPQADLGLHGAAVTGADGVQPGRLRLAAGYALPEAGADLKLEVARETRGADADPNLGVRLSATLGW